MNFLRKRPWIIVVAAFVGFVVWWVFFITFAIKHQPEQVPLVTKPGASNAGH